MDGSLKISQKSKQNGCGVYDSNWVVEYICRRLLRQISTRHSSRAIEDNEVGVNVSNCESLDIPCLQEQVCVRCRIKIGTYNNRPFHCYFHISCWYVHIVCSREKQLQRHSRLTLQLKPQVKEVKRLQGISIAPYPLNPLIPCVLI